MKSKQDISEALTEVKILLRQKFEQQNEILLKEGKTRLDLEEHKKVSDRIKALYARQSVLEWVLKD